MTPSRAAALGKALAARRACPLCGTDPGYHPSRRLGCCNQCADELGPAA